MAALHSTDTRDGGDVFDRVSRELAEQGWSVLDGVLPDRMVEELFVHITALPDESWQRAGIGREGEHHTNLFIRRDETMWVQPDQIELRGYFEWMETLRLALNRRLFLGLFDLEAHYARYAPGAFYQKHRDSFAGSGTNRVLSSVLYLNPHWTPDAGGELRIFDDAGQAEIATLEPFYGRLVLFLSERIPHEVLPTTRARFSLTGWFRVNNSVGGVVDPPA